MQKKPTCVVIWLVYTGTFLEYFCRVLKTKINIFTKVLLISGGRFHLGENQIYVMEMSISEPKGAF